MSTLTDLQAIRDDLISALATDAAAAAAGRDSTIDYSLDGESVSREAWRAGTMQRLKELQEYMLMYDPFEIRTVAL